MYNKVEEDRRLEVIIVGAGVGGLLLGSLMERLGHSYHIYERATELRQLGPNILPVFEQLGLLEELYSISMPCPASDVYNADMSLFGTVKLLDPEVVGYHGVLFERPKLYELMRKQIPDSKITLSKKVIGTHETKDGRRVSIHCADGTSYEGDIVFGADGAHSGVRQSLFKRMEEQGVLPESDLQDFSVGNVCIVGVADCDPEKYPQLKDNFSHFTTTLLAGMRGVNVATVPGNRICWALGQQLPEEEASKTYFQNAEWGSDANDVMIKEFRDVPCPWGGVVGDIIDKTPKDLISKVILEEKVFLTWHYGRTALLGDACHKMLTGAGQGAVNAMEDAVAIANCIYNLPETSSESIHSAFKEYYRQRYDRALSSFEYSRTMTRVLFGHTWKERLMRQLAIKYMPDWLRERMAIEQYAYRPQVAWLPLAPNRGRGHVLAQEGKRIADKPLVTTF
ncbi:hypothetical protein EDD11_003360 [Mortierella claussenii]|nr:hypothetical protein EDD11_003360 [Mortierella claussenii]